MISQVEAFHDSKDNINKLSQTLVGQKTDDGPMAVIAKRNGLLRKLVHNISSTSYTLKYLEGQKVCYEKHVLDELSKCEQVKMTALGSQVLNVVVISLMLFPWLLVHVFALRTI